MHLPTFSAGYPTMPPPRFSAESSDKKPAHIASGKSFEELMDEANNPPPPVLTKEEKDKIGDATEMLVNGNPAEGIEVLFNVIFPNDKGTDSKKS